ncbi:flagellar motor switch phosphatase FliY [Halalkalibacillus sediminis]|uniref:Flagellar motor switch phosphatase FliY n=1 Tax=Halalkalibacillus sediminis TaxID=2018042 RepID=A0A2I0QX04_9BACI|nr:flagellar motor switch phosphatase FliY [Halalkalibacillus sediminis]PKR78630.1 flagellar motor switch phosphatase FliY [Halalkalibacillus sediminis]
MNKNDDMLSQEEIDALLNGEQSSGSDEPNNSEDKVQDQVESNGSDPLIEDHLSSIEVDAIGELGNISFGSSATALSTLLNQKVEITTPTVSMVSNEDLEDEFPTPHVAVFVHYTEGFEGSNLFIIRNKDAAIIADLMLGGDGTSPNEDLGEIQLSAVQEAMNQMMGSAATSMSSIFNKRIDISPPKTMLLDVPAGEGTEYVPNESLFVKVSFDLKVGTLIDSSIMQLLPVHFAKDFVDELLNADEEEDASTQKSQNDTQPSQQKKKSEPVEQSTQQTSNQGQTKDTRRPQQIGGSGRSGSSEVESAQFSDFNEDNALESHEKRNLDLLMDIPLDVSVELGRTRRTIKDILDMSAGSIVELDKLAGEPVDILVNNKLIAKGEVVVIEENFGVRVTDILTQSERLKKLR